jgi:hypothetical protein
MRSIAAAAALFEDIYGGVEVCDGGGGGAVEGVKLTSWGRCQELQG